MSKQKALKLTVGLLSTALFLTVPTAIAKANTFTFAEEGVAGITAILADKTDQQIEEAYEASVPKVKSPYENLGVSTAESFVNIRKKASTDSQIVGKLYRGCAANILEYIDGGWVKIKSGDVEGYIATQFLAIGEKAEKMVDEYATIYGTVNTETLNVRVKPSTEAKIWEQVPRGEKYIVTKRKDGWAEILLGTDNDGEDLVGYVSEDYVKIDVKFKYAISIEEENRIKKEQEKAEKAEKERKAKLAQEKAEREAAAKKAAEDKKKAQNSANNNNTNNNTGTSNNTNNTPPPTSSSHTGSEIVNYALKFVGNPYKWAGTSLTNGADCSGFTQAIYGDFGISIGRTSRDQAAGAGTGRVVSVSEMQAGDLIFYANSSGVVNHVALYMGDGRIVHAANKRQGIIVSQYNYRAVYRVRRVIN